MSRRNLARLVLVIWIGALGLLARRTLFPEEGASLAAGAARLSPDARYYRVEVGGLQVGVINMNWDTLPTGFRVVEMLGLDLPAHESTRRHLQVTEATTTRALTLLSANRRYTGPAGSEEVSLAVNDGAHLFRVRSPGTAGAESGVLQFESRATLPQILPLRLAYGGGFAEAGPLQVVVADLEHRRAGTTAVRLMGDTVFVLADSVELDSARGVWRTVTQATVTAHRYELSRGGLTERWYVDEVGRLVRLQTPFGVTVQRGPYEYTHLLYRDSLATGGAAPRRALAGVRTLAGSAVRLDTLATRMRFRLSRTDGPLPPGAAALVAGGAQVVTGDDVAVTREWPTGTGPAPDGYLAVPGPRGEPTGRMRMLADSAFAGAATTRDSVVRMLAWLRRWAALDTAEVRHTEPELTVRRRAVGVDGLARWAVILARAGGIPARAVTGVAVTGEGLLAHSWAELWIGGRWLPVDPASGHAPASARLLRLAEGGLGRPFETLWRAGALRVEPLAPDGP